MIGRTPKRSFSADDAKRKRGFSPTRYFGSRRNDSLDEGKRGFSPTRYFGSRRNASLDEAKLRENKRREEIMKENMTTEESKKSSPLTLVRRLGGREGLKKIMDVFLDRMVADERLVHFFEHIPATKLKMHQIRFFSLAFGGNAPGMISGLSNPGEEESIDRNEKLIKFLIEKHVRLFSTHGLNETHCDVVIQHFLASLEHLEVPQEYINEASGILRTLRVAFQRGALLHGQQNKKNKPNDSLLENEQELLAKVGGKTVLGAILREFSERLTNDELLAPFFQNMDVRLMNPHHLAILRGVLLSTKTQDGKASFDEDYKAHLTEQHETVFQRGFNRKHFSRVKRHFTEVLVLVGVPKDVVNEAELAFRSFYSLLAGESGMLLERVGRSRSFSPIEA